MTAPPESLLANIARLLDDDIRRMFPILDALAPLPPGEVALRAELRLRIAAAVATRLEREAEQRRRELLAFTPRFPPLDVDVEQARLEAMRLRILELRRRLVP